MRVSLKSDSNATSIWNRLDAEVVKVVWSALSVCVKVGCFLALDVESLVAMLGKLLGGVDGDE